MKTEASIVNDQIVLAINIDLNKKELEKFFSLQKNGVIRRVGRDLQLTIWENFVAPNDIPGIHISRRVGRNATQEDFDSIRNDAKKFMDWFTKVRLPEELSAEKEQLKKSFEDCKMRAVVTLMQLASLLEELHSLNTRIFGYEKDEPEVPNDAQKA